MTKKKKKKTLTLRQMMLRDTGKGLENFNKPPTKINVFDKARSIKTWRQLQHILESYAPGVAYPSTVAGIILKHVRDNWNTYKILSDPDHYGAIVRLVNFVSKVGAPRAFKSQHLKVFCRWTGFRKPTTVNTFFNDVTMFREFLGIKRDKSGKYSKERSSKESLRRMKKLNKLSKYKSINYNDYEQTEHGWRKK